MEIMSFILSFKNRARYLYSCSKYLLKLICETFIYIPVLAVEFYLEKNYVKNYNWSG